MIASSLFNLEETSGEGAFLFSCVVKVELEVSGACLRSVGLNLVNKHTLKTVSRGVPAFNQISMGLQVIRTV